MQSGKSRILLYFRKNAVGEYIYECPMYAESKDYSGDLYVPYGLYATSKILNNRLLTFDDNMKKKLFSNKSVSISLKPLNKYFIDGNQIFVSIPDEVELIIYHSLKDELKREPTNSEILRRLTIFADRFGKNVEIIKKKNSNYFANTKGDINTIPADQSVIETVFLNPKPIQAQAEASASSGKTVQTRISPASVVHKKNAINIEKKSNRNLSNDHLTDKKGDDDNYSNSNESFAEQKLSRDDLIRIKTEIRKKVIGQDKAIDDIVNNIYFNQLAISSKNKDLLRGKANIILDGSTGTGKTFILEEVASQLNLPIVITPATKYSAVGYKGDDITGILYKLLEKSDGNLELAERGIVAFDEFDKLGSSSENDIAMRRSIQQELLTFIGGTQFDIEYKGKNYSFDTSKLTIIGMGAFTSLRERKIADNEKRYKPSVGFSTAGDNDIKRNYTITKDDYVNEGLERELVGRFSCITYTNDLTIEDMKRILTESISSPLEWLKMTGRLCGCNINISDDIIYDIARKAYNTNTGARGLNYIVQALKDVVANDIISSDGSIDITNEHLDKTDSIHNRSYNVKEVG